MELNLEFKDLSGDKVFDAFKVGLKEGVILTGRVTERKKCTPHDARKIIELKYVEGKKEIFSTYNYNKVLKSLK